MASVVVGKSSTDLAEKLGKFFEKFFFENYGKAEFIIGLSGGSMVQMLADVFSKLDNINWSVVKFILCDERIVPFDDSESNFGSYKQILLPALGGKMKENQFVVIDPNLKPTECALDYEKKLRQLRNTCDFDLLLLGLGPDGHTCSLFQGHKLLKESCALVAAIEDSPKPPPQRVTLTLPAVNRAKHILFITTGNGKAKAIKEIFEDCDCQLPGALGIIHKLHDTLVVKLVDMRARRP